MGTPVLYVHRHKTLSSRGTQNNSVADPLFYIPLKDLEKGPAKISKDKSYDQGFWIGTLSLDDQRIEIAGFDAGPLEGLVKIPVNALGRSRWTAATTRSGSVSTSTRQLGRPFSK